MTSTHGEPAPPGDPLVSLCIPTYNRAGMVGDAIRSALAQTYRNLEVLVVDNASTDGTDEVVASFHDPRLRYVRNDRNLGLFGNFNRCIELAQGKYLHILHSDDTIPPEFTATCVRFMEIHSEVALTFTPVQIVGAEREPPSSPPSQEVILPPPQGFRQILAVRSLIPCPTVMVRRDVYREVGPYSLEFPYSSDYFQWLKIARIHSLGYIPQTHLEYRQGTHTESYRLLFESPEGYMDMLRILTRLNSELRDDAGCSREDLDPALERLIGDCLYALWTRADRMVGYPPQICTGIALTTWSLIWPSSLYSRARKAGMLLAILGSAVLYRVPGIRTLARWWLTRKRSLY